VASRRSRPAASLQQQQQQQEEEEEERLGESEEEEEEEEQLALLASAKPRSSRLLLLEEGDLRSGREDAGSWKQEGSGQLLSERAAAEHALREEATRQRLLSWFRAHSSTQRQEAL
jgi:hypothetical protein